MNILDPGPLCYPSVIHPKGVLMLADVLDLILYRVLAKTKVDRR